MCLVSDGATVDRLTARTGLQPPVGLADMVAAMNRAHANDRVYVTILEHTAQAVLEGEALPEVPISMGECAGAVEGCTEDAVDEREAWWRLGRQRLAMR